MMEARKMRMMPKTEGDNYSMGLRGLDAVILEPGVISGTGLLALKANHSTEIGAAMITTDARRFRRGGAHRLQPMSVLLRRSSLRTDQKFTTSAHPNVQQLILRIRTIYCRESRACEKGILQARLDIALKKLSLES